MSAWQAIETAPEDASRVLVTDGKTVFIGIRKMFGEGRYETFRDEEVVPGHSWSVEGVTHWMPLPSPPEAAS